MNKPARHQPASIQLTAVGDVFVNREDPARIFANVSHLLQGGDITFGNSEGTYAVNPKAEDTMLAAILASPDNIRTLAQTGFDVMSVANNHVNDYGRAGMHATIGKLRSEGIQPVGYGKDVDEAFAPVYVDAHGMRVAFIAASAIGAWNAAATEDQDGVAMVDVHTQYVDSHNRQPGSPVHVRSQLTEAARARIAASFDEASRNADFAVASFHWGVHFFPALLAEYEGELARLAIDHGADVVLGHHQHIVKGIDFYKGKPILHGLGNFAFDLVDAEKIIKAETLREAVEIFGEYSLFSREGYPTYPFHEEARMTMVAHIDLEAGRDPVVSLTPCMINSKGQPTPVLPSDEAGFGRFVAYMKRELAGRGACAYGSAGQPDRGPQRIGHLSPAKSSGARQFSPSFYWMCRRKTFQRPAGVRGPSAQARSGHLSCAARGQVRQRADVRPDGRDALCNGGVQKADRDRGGTCGHRRDQETPRGHCRTWLYGGCHRHRALGRSPDRLLWLLPA
ncbi:CapA family protein [Polaromonas sp. P1-6]|nr:CapA family protein [Polaromonas sp. P1-6]